MLGGADEATRVALLTGSLSAARRREALLDAASGQAGIVDRHPRAPRGRRAVRRPRARRRRRAAPVRRRAAGGADEQGRLHAAARAGDDRDPDPAHRRDDRLRRPRRLDAARAPGRAGADPDHRRAGRRAAGLARPGLAAGPRGGRARGIRCTSSARGSAASPSRRCEEAARRRRVASRVAPPVAVADVAAELAEGPLAGLRLFVLHGRLPADEKDDLMRGFAAGDIDVLVATTVIEVGVDVANASVMVVMDADRFGVSQLHQLRGRVGRGTVDGLCLLVTDAADGHAGARAAGRRRGHLRRVRAGPRSTSRTAARATCSAPPSPAGGRACGCCRCCATRTSSPPRATAAEAVVDADPAPRAAIPALAARGRRARRVRAGRLPGEVVTRIIGGSAGGRRLRTPPGDATRPTADRVREALFSRLESRARHPRGLPFPRRVRRVGRRRARGELARRDRGDAGRAHRGGGRPDPVQRGRPRLRGRAGDPRGRPTSSPGGVPPGAVRRRVLRPAVRPVATMRSAMSITALPQADWLAPDAAGRGRAVARGDGWDWPPGSTGCARRSTARQCFGTVTRRRDGTVRRPGVKVRRPNAQGSMPGFVRPGDQRPPRHRGAPAGLFDEVIVGVLVNEAKQGLFTRRRADRHADGVGQALELDNVSVRRFSGLLVDFCRDHDIGDRQGSARSQRLRLRVADGADESEPVRGRHGLHADESRMVVSWHRAWSRKWLDLAEMCPNSYRLMCLPGFESGSVQSVHTELRGRR